MIRYRLKEGAPPDGELFIVAKLRKKYQPSLNVYHPYEGRDRPTNLIECLEYDRDCINDHSYYIPEFFDSSYNEGEESVEWEVVDSEGTVWSEAYEDDVEDNTEGK